LVDLRSRLGHPRAGEDLAGNVLKVTGVRSAAYGFDAAGDHVIVGLFAPLVGHPGSETL
jgi:hypothetical protein